jgi:hypothetical protein
VDGPTVSSNQPAADREMRSRHVQMQIADAITSREKRCLFRVIATCNLIEIPINV